mmetsp:Transcript_18575/g.24021  ORF Transcript_18575/g.24021 Transcript_18575/m.24021 type:complete len:159 (-) Transcript_18575:213-689(-)
MNSLFFLTIGVIVFTFFTSQTAAFQTSPLLFQRSISQGKITPFGTPTFKKTYQIDEISSSRSPSLTVKASGEDTESGPPLPIIIPGFPAYGYLGLSGVTAIAFVGSIFEVSGPNPVLGYPLTWVILVAAFPGFLYLFYCAITKGQQEAEEPDDFKDFF